MTGLVMLAVAVVFSAVGSPLAMGGLLLVYASASSLFMGLLSSTFWFSYILFLVFLGGVLILFIYIASLTPNVKYSMKVWLVGAVVCISCLSGVFLVWDGLALSSPAHLGSSGQVGSHLSPVLELYSQAGVRGSAYMVVYLLLALIVVVKLTTSSGGALRASY